MDHRDLPALVARMQKLVTIATQPAAKSEDLRELSDAWNALVRHLDVGPAAPTRKCPACSREIMRAATMCGHCWTKSTAEAG